MSGGYGAAGGRGSGGYGTGGGRGPGDRQPGDRQPGYRDSGPDDDSYGYGAPPGTGGYGVQGQGGQGGQGGQRYGGRGPGQPGQQGSRPGPGTGQPRGQGPRQAPGRGQEWRGQEYGQEYGQPGGWPDPWPQPQRPGTGSGPQQYPQGYDPRGAAPRRAADGYPPDGYQSRGDARYAREGYPGREPGQREDSFLPGFGGPDEYDDRRAPRGRGGRYPDEAGAYDDEHEDRRAPRGQRDRRGRGDRHGDGQPARPRRGPVRRLAPWIALLVVLTPLVVGGVYGYSKYESRYHPADYPGPGTGTVTVQVSKGDTAFSLAPRLVSLGVVASTRAFENAAEASANTAGLEAGFYTLHHQMKASLAWAALLDAKNRVQTVVTIPEGKRASQVIAILAKQTKIPLANFQQVIDHPAQLGLPSYANGKAEGYLFPATYPVQPHQTALQILRAMVQRYDVEAQQINLAAAAAKLGLTPEQVIIEASMVQAEGGSVSDYPKIARVIINRLHDGMKLQFDSVLLYGLNAYGINVTFKQINTPGPYNDFEHAGLPPGPICNPGDAAIQGVLHPAPGPWLYFLTNTGGKSTFSATPLQGQ